MAPSPLKDTASEPEHKNEERERRNIEESELNEQLIAEVEELIQWIRRRLNLFTTHGTYTYIIVRSFLFYFRQ